MNKTEFIEIIAPLAEYYGKTLTDAAVMVYFQASKEIDANAFQHLINLHMGDPDQGKFFPTLAHLAGQASDEKTVTRQAGIEFDTNPRADGSSTFDIQQESKYQLDIRRKRFIANVVEEWSAASTVERIACSEKIPLEYREPMLIALASHTGPISLEHQKND